MVRQRHVAGIGTYPPPISPVSAIVWGGAKWARRDERGAITAEAGNTVDANGLEGFPLALRQEDDSRAVDQP